jgi:hypothetical protein
MNGGLREVGDGHRLTGAHAVHAGALVGLDLQQLHPVGLLAGGGHHPELTVRVDEHDPGGLRGQQGHAVADQPVEHVDHVVVVHQGVGQPDERRRHPLLPVILGLAHVESFPEWVVMRCPARDRRPDSVLGCGHRDSMSAMHTSRRRPRHRPPPAAAADDDPQADQRVPSGNAELNQHHTGDLVHFGGRCTPRPTRSRLPDSTYPPSAPKRPPSPRRHSHRRADP